MDDCERGIFFGSFSPITAKHQDPSAFDLMLIEDLDSIIGKVAYRLRYQTLNMIDADN